MTGQIADEYRCPMCAHRFNRHGPRGCEVVMMLNAGACRCTMTAEQLWMVPPAAQPAPEGGRERGDTMVGPRAKTTPDGLETAAELARVALKAERALYLEVKRLLKEPERDDLVAWAESLTETNCDWRLYQVGQQILLDYPVLRSEHPDEVGSLPTVVVPSDQPKLP